MCNNFPSDCVKYLITPQTHKSVCFLINKSVFYFEYKKKNKQQTEQMFNKSIFNK